MLPLTLSQLLDPRGCSQPLGLLCTSFPGLHGELGGCHRHGEQQGGEGLVMEQVEPHPLSLKQNKTKPVCFSCIYNISALCFFFLLLLAAGF